MPQKQPASELLISKHFLGEHAPDLPSLNMLYLKIPATGRCFNAASASVPIAALPVIVAVIAAPIAASCRNTVHSIS